MKSVTEFFTQLTDSVSSTHKYTAYSIFYITCLIIEGNRVRKCSSEDMRSVAMITQNDPMITDGFGVRWKKMMSTIYAKIISKAPM